MLVVLVQKETEHIHDRIVHPRILLVALEVLGAETAKRLPEYSGQYHHMCALYSPLCICCKLQDTEQDEKLSAGIWMRTYKLPRAWSPPDNQPHPCEKATTTL